MVTGLIMFRILKAFMEYKPRSVVGERTLGTFEDTKFRHAIFVIIESGMVLFAIQMLRFVLFELPEESATIAFILVIGINQMFNVIIRFVHFYFFHSTDNIYLGHRTNINFGAGLNENVIRRQ